MKTSVTGREGLTDRMRWLQARARVISENVANADTPGFVARDVVPVKGSGSRQPVMTHKRHMAADPGNGTGTMLAQKFETRPNGNAVSLEDEMLRLAETQLEYQMMTSLYQRSMATLKTALGRRS